MLDKYIESLKSAISGISRNWIILGALISVILILAIGLLMTLNTARTQFTEQGQNIIIRSRSRRNIIFTIAFMFAIFSALLTINAYPGATFLHLTVLLYLSVPALVLLWAFISEAIFECIDDRNRRKLGTEICCCGINANSVKTGAAQRNTVPENSRAEKEKTLQTKEQPESNKAALQGGQTAAQKNLPPVKREETPSKHTQTELNEPQTETTEKKLGASTEEDLRRRKFEEERKMLAILARQAKAAEFGKDAGTRSELVKSSAPKLQAETAAPVSPSKPASTTAQTTVTTASTEKPSLLIKKTQSDKNESETTTDKQDVNARFNSLQAKLETLRKDTAKARPANKSETRGKYDEEEVKSALADLIKSMNARRNLSEE